jgi:hypothetical protein
MASFAPNFRTPFGHKHQEQEAKMTPNWWTD